MDQMASYGLGTSGLRPGGVVVTFTVKEHQPDKDMHVREGHHHKAANRRKTNAGSARKMVGNSLGGLRKTSKSGGNGEQTNRRRRKGVEGENAEGGGEGRGGKRTTSAGTPKGGWERGVARKSHTIESAASVPAKSTITSNSISGGDQPPAISKAIPSEEEVRNQRNKGSTTRPRTFVRQRPLSAAAAVAPSGTSSKRQDFVSPAAATAHGRVAFEDHHKTGGRTGASSPSKNNRGTRPRGVPTCWGAERIPGRRPKPLGKTNTSKPVAEGEISRSGMWNSSCSCDDLALGLIDKDMERAIREWNLNNNDESPAALPASKSLPSQTTQRHRREKRPSSRPTTGTCAKLIFTPDYYNCCTGGDEAKGPYPSRQEKTGDSSTAKVVPTRPKKGSATADRSNVAAAGAEPRRRSEWNFSTRVDDLPPDALLRKHPGWDAAARAREVGVRIQNRGGFFCGGSTARTITTISSSSAARDV